MRCATARQPSSNSARLKTATNTNVRGNRWVNAARTPRPTTVAPAHTAVPTGNRNGARHARPTSQPMTNPIRNGDAVVSTSNASTISACEPRPTAANTSTASTSAPAASITVAGRTVGVVTAGSLSLPGSRSVRANPQRAQDPLGSAVPGFWLRADARAASSIRLATTSACSGTEFSLSGPIPRSCTFNGNSCSDG